MADMERHCDVRMTPGMKDVEPVMQNVTGILAATPIVSASDCNKHSYNSISATWMRRGLTCHVKQ